MAKLHSWVRSNSSRCGGDITLSTRSRACCGVSGFWVIGEILPFTLIDGGMPAVMNGSDAFWCAISLRNERSEERRIGKECVSTWSSRWAQYHLKKKQKE